MTVYNKHQFPGRPDTRSVSQRNWDAGQYPMFMDAEEVNDPAGVRHGDLRDHQTVEHLREEKVEESKRSSNKYDGITAALRRKRGIMDDDEVPLYDDIAANGVKKPITMDVPTEDTKGRAWMTNGHHRAFAAEDVQRKTGQTRWLTVNWSDPSDQTV